MENKLKGYFDTQMENPEFAEAWKETEASYQAATILLRIREEKQSKYLQKLLSSSGFYASSYSIFFSELYLPNLPRQEYP